jgi:hypothetical protein
MFWFIFHNYRVLHKPLSRPWSESRTKVGSYCCSPYRWVFAPRVTHEKSSRIFKTKQCVYFMEVLGEGGGGGRGHASQKHMPYLTSLNKWNVSHIDSFVTTLQSILRFDYGLDDPEIPLFWSWDLHVEVPKGTGHGFPGSTRLAAHLHTIPKWTMRTAAPKETSKSAWLGDSLGTNTNSHLLSHFSCALLLVGSTYTSVIPDKGRRSSPTYHNG